MYFKPALKITFINSANEAQNLVLILHVFRFVHIVSNATANSFMVCFVSMYVHIIFKLSTHVKNGAIVFMTFPLWFCDLMPTAETRCG